MVEGRERGTEKKERVYEGGERGTNCENLHGNCSGSR